MYFYLPPGYDVKLHPDLGKSYSKKHPSRRQGETTAVPFPQDNHDQNKPCLSQQHTRGHSQRSLVQQGLPCIPGDTQLSSSVLDNKRKTIIGSLDVRTMHHSGQLENILKEMECIEINILGISEVRWTNSGKLNTNNHAIIYVLWRAALCKRNLIYS